MNYFKYINLIVFTWALEALDKEPQETIDFAVGGQAVVEGVMMRSPNNIAIAVRKPKGEIAMKKYPFQTLTQKHRWLNVPILRGVVNLFEMMLVGTTAINYSANESIEEELKETRKETKLSKFIEIVMFIVSFIIAIALSIALFKFTPLWITTFLQEKVPYVKENYIIFNLIDGILKALIFVGYISLLTLAKSFRRIFEYHGAEHKSIFTYENKLPLTPENAAKQTRFHPRCGTSFIIIVFVISIIVYTFVPKQENFWTNLSLRLAFLPIIAGISYEYLKISAKHANNFFVKMMIEPGLLFQKLTTKEPDTHQLEVGLKSLSDILEMEKS